MFKLYADLDTSYDMTTGMVMMVVLAKNTHGKFPRIVKSQLSKFIRYVCVAKSINNLVITSWVYDISRFYVNEVQTLNFALNVSG